MTTHIILASTFILSVLLGLIFTFIDDNSTHDFGSLIATFLIISVFLMFATIVQGVCYGEKIHYRKRHAPLIEDVNNGHAKLIEYKTIDTILLYNIEWLGDNQDGEREINYK